MKIAKKIRNGSRNKYGAIRLESIWTFINLSSYLTGGIAPARNIFTQSDNSRREYYLPVSAAIVSSIALAAS